MIVTMLGGPHDGQQFQMPDGAREFHVALTYNPEWVADPNDVPRTTTDDTARYTTIRLTLTPAGDVVADWANRDPR